MARKKPSRRSKASTGKRKTKRAPKRKAAVRARKPARKPRISRKPKKPARARKAIRKPKIARAPPAPMTPILPKKTLVGTVAHFFTDLSVAVVDLADTIRAGERISIEGSTTSLVQEISSMQVSRVPVFEAHAGESVGLKVIDRVREGDRVFRLEG